MDFERVLELVGEFLDAGRFSYAIIGALGLHAYGLTRATSDLDFVTEADAQPSLVSFLVSKGYETLYVSPGYSNHFHSDLSLGRVDFVYVGGETGRRLFEGCREFPLGGRRIRVPRPEHLAAMKVQAMKNDLSRTFQELADIRFLLGLPGINEEEVRVYFERAGLRDRYDEIKRLG